jgi:hypothetical protein
MTTADIVLILALALLVVLAVLPLRSVHVPSRRSGAAFGLLLVLALAAGHWQSLRDNRPWLNPDEAHMLAGALTLRHDPIFWLSVDGTTHGPVDQWPLVFVSWTGLPLDFQAARLLSVACQAGMLLLLLKYLSTHSAKASRLGLLPAAIWLSTNQEPEFHQLCSEHVPMFLLAAAIVTGFPARLEMLPRWRAVLIGVLLVSLPFAKLQSAPLSAALGGCWLWCMVRTRRKWAGALWSVILGGAIAGLVILGPSLLAGAGGEFWTSYVVANKNYTMGGIWNPPWPRYVWGLNYLLAITTALLAIAGLASPRILLRHPSLPLGVTMTVAGFFAIFLPGHPILHYWLLLVPALVVLAGTAWQVTLTTWTPIGRLVLAGTLSLGIALLFVSKRQLQPYSRWDDQFDRPPTVNTPALSAIHRLSSNSDSLAVWGWAPELYVQTQRRQAVREAQTSAQIYPGPLQAHFRRRYLGDLQRNRPAVFVDAVHPGAFTFHDRPQHAHEIFPALHDWLDKNYELDGDYDGLRLYRLHR